jgi:hypothetical protein
VAGALAPKNVKKMIFTEPGIPYHFKKGECSGIPVNSDHAA